MRGMARSFQCLRLQAKMPQRTQLAAAVLEEELQSRQSRHLATGSTRIGVQIKSSCVDRQFRHAPTSSAHRSTSSTGASECWNCGKATTAPGSFMICASCSHLQDVDPQINYFDLLSIPQDFGLEPQELTRRFRQLQTLVHPDKFSNKTAREQINSADWSAVINRAYKTLAVPIERGQYMLALHGQQIPQDNSALDKVFLMAMMERNEEVEEAETRDQLQSLNAQIARELNEKVAALSAQFQTGGSLQSAKAILVEMKYLTSIQTSIKNKLQALLATDN